MSKIGRKPILLRDVKVEIKGNEVYYSGKNSQGAHAVPEILSISIEDGCLFITAEKANKNVRKLWGLHRSLLSNKIVGAQTLFEQQIKIVGLGYKAIAKGSKIEFSLGFSHKIEFDLIKDVTVDIDKTGQLLTLKSFDKELVGKVGGEMKRLRPVEPYKGTGVRLTTDVVLRKAGKAKGA